MSSGLGAIKYTDNKGIVNEGSLEIPDQDGANCCLTRTPGDETSEPNVHQVLG